MATLKRVSTTKWIRTNEEKNDQSSARRTSLRHAKERGMDEVKRVHREKHVLELELLQRSFFGESLHPIQIDGLADEILNQWNSITKVRGMGTHKVIVTFASKEDMEKALTVGKDFFLKYFVEIRR